MNNALKAVLAALVLVIAALGIVLATNTGDTPLDDPATPTASTESGPEAPDPAEHATAGVQDDEGPAERRTTRRTIDPATPRNAGTELPQGIRGRVVDSYGQPVPEAELHLIEDPLNNLFETVQRMQRGMNPAPIASTVADEQGRFAIGVTETLAYKLHVYSDEHQPRFVDIEEIQPEDWYDCGDIELEQGCVIQGTVTEEGTGAPLADAKVTVQTGNQLNAVALPGREGGTFAITDPSGFYRISTAPGGVMSVTCKAEGHAGISKSDVELEKGQPETVDFQLPVGYTISGVVVDVTGEPVPAATIRARSLSSKQPQLADATTDRQGRFAIPDLQDGPFQLDVEAQDYQSHTESPVMSKGSGNLVLTLEQKSGVRVRVLTADRTPLRQYRLRVLRSFPQNNSIGLVPGQGMRRVTGRDLENGAVRISGLDVGNYVFEVRARGYAKTYSDTVNIGPGVDPGIVEVVMDRGGRLYGRVVDSGGRPVAGAVVKTEPEGLVDLSDSGIGKFFSQIAASAPTRLSRREERTDAEGGFDLRALSAGEYQLRVTHPEYVGTVASGLLVESGDTIEVPPIRLATGTKVSGTVTVNGTPQGQVEIVLAPPTQAVKDLPANERFNARAISRNDGTWTLNKLVPSGQYEIKAGRTNAGPFMKIVDHKSSTRQISVGSGGEMHLDLDIVARDN